MELVLLVETILWMWKDKNSLVRHESRVLLPTTVGTFLVRN